MNGFTKLHASIVASTIWRAPDHVRLVWITMLAMADQHGEVSASVPGLAAMANVTVEACDAAVEALLSPDKYSRTPDFAGRRIEPCEGGWRLLNHEKYRRLSSAEDRLAKDADRKRRARAREKDASADIRNHPQPSAMSRQAEAETDAEEEEEAKAARSENSDGRENRMLAPSPARGHDSARADIAWMNRLCAQVTCWTGSLLDGDKLERTAGELVTRGAACAAERGVGHRELIELVLRHWWTPKRMATRKAWIVMALQDWHETLAEVDAEQERKERAEGAARAH